jgi:hypothetical protein
MFRKTLLFLSLIAPLTPAFAQQADGTWRCAANGNIPIGVVTITGAGYTFTSTNTAWEPVDNAANGAGSLGFDGPLSFAARRPPCHQFRRHRPSGRKRGLSRLEQQQRQSHGLPPRLKRYRQSLGEDRPSSPKLP